MRKFFDFRVRLSVRGEYGGKGDLHRRTAVYRRYVEFGVCDGKPFQHLLFRDVRLCTDRAVFYRESIGYREIRARYRSDSVAFDDAYRYGGEYRLDMGLFRSVGRVSSGDLLRL